MKKYSPSAILALKEALSNIYWRKKDLRSFIYHAINNKAIVSTVDWENNTKYENVSNLLDRMVTRTDIYNDDILSLFDAVMHFSDFSHLLKWDEADMKVKRAKDSVESLKKHAQGCFQLLEEKERSIQRRKAYSEMLAEKREFDAKLIMLKDDFEKLLVAKNATQRGYSLEKFLNDLFLFYDLDPKSSFKIVGEQIDGAFTFDSSDYLLEAKWQQDPVNAGDLYKFAGKLSGKLKNTLGLFISINGFSSESIQVDSPGIKSMILMDGSDIYAIVENRIDLKDLLYRKRRHASETGNIYLKYKEM